MTYDLFFPFFFLSELVVSTGVIYHLRLSKMTSRMVLRSKVAFALTLLHILCRCFLGSSPYVYPFPFGRNQLSMWRGNPQGGRHSLHSLICNSNTSQGHPRSNRREKPSTDYQWTDQPVNNWLKGDLVNAGAIYQVPLARSLSSTACDI